MTYGPCGGVQDDGACEIGGACPFVEPLPPAGAGSDGVGGSGLAARAGLHQTWAQAAAGARRDRELGPEAEALRARLELDAALNAKLGPTSARPFVVADLPSAGLGPE